MPVFVFQAHTNGILLLQMVPMLGGSNFSWLAGLLDRHSGGGPRLSATQNPTEDMATTTIASLGTAVATYIHVGGPSSTHWRGSLQADLPSSR